MPVETSDYCRSFLIEDTDVDIEIFRPDGTHGWQLELKINGHLVETPNVFLADKAAYDHAIELLKQNGHDPQILAADDFGIIDSPLSQRVLVEGHPFEIKIYRGVDEPEWLLEIVNAKGTSIVPEQTFKTDREALATAMADFETDPIEEFLG